MVTVVRSVPTIGTGIGRGFSQGLTERLNQMAEQKAREVHQGNIVNALLKGLQGQPTQQDPLQQGQQQDQTQDQVMSQETMPSQQAPRPNSFVNDVLNAGGDLQLAKLVNDARHKESQEALGQQKLNQKDKQFNYTINKDFIQGIEDRGRKAKFEAPILKRIIKITKDGDLRDAKTLSLMNSLYGELGINLESVLNGDELELQKLQRFFLRGGPETFGGKVSNFEAQTLLGSVPGLMQTPEGRLRIADQMLKQIDLEEKEQRVYDDIIKKNNGVIPDGLRQKFNEKMQPFYDKYADDFVNALTSKQAAKGARVNDLPSASQNEGRRIRDTETGQVLIAKNGKWVKE